MVGFTAEISKLMAAHLNYTAEHQVMKHSYMQLKEATKCVCDFDVNLSGGSSVLQEKEFCKF